MIHPVMTRAEADKIVSWAEENLTVSMTAWQKEIFAVMLMHPDLEFSLPGCRRG